MPVTELRFPNHPLRLEGLHESRDGGSLCGSPADPVLAVHVAAGQVIVAKFAVEPVLRRIGYMRRIGRRNKVGEELGKDASGASPVVANVDDQATGSGKARHPGRDLFKCFFKPACNSQIRDVSGEKPRLGNGPVFDDRRFVGDLQNGRDSPRAISRLELDLDNVGVVDSRD